MYGNWIENGQVMHWILREIGLPVVNLDAAVDAALEGQRQALTHHAPGIIPGPRDLMRAALEAALPVILAAVADGSLETATCAHCGQPVERCTAPQTFGNDAPGCKGWRHAGRYSPLWISHRCELMNRESLHAEPKEAQP
jgi:hypothetical protein